MKTFITCLVAAVLTLTGCTIESDSPANSTPTSADNVEVPDELLDWITEAMPVAARMETISGDIADAALDYDVSALLAGCERLLNAANDMIAVDAPVAPDGWGDAGRSYRSAAQACLNMDLETSTEYIYEANDHMNAATAVLEDYL